MHPPEDVAGVRRLLGLVNHIRRFLPHVSEATAPIRALLLKNSTWTWGPPQQSAFSELKKLLCSDHCVARYNTTHKTTISADASSYVLAAVLLQEQPSGERRAIAFASRSLTSTERRYVQTEKEALAASWAVQRFEEDVRGLQFLLKTDHQPLVAHLGSMDVDLLPPRVQRFRLKLMRFQYQRYWKYQADLSVSEGLLLKGSRILVTSALQRHMLELLHDRHQGINRCKALAQESVWWPGINNQIETFVCNCHTCAETRVQHSEPMLPSSTPCRPWEAVGIDLFHLNGQDIVLLVDYRSCFPEIISLRSTTELGRSGGNGPQFAVKEFSAFAKSYDFCHVTSSPHFPQSNGEFERMVRTVKDKLRKADDPYLPLLAYRDTPGVNGVSPAQMLVSRRLQTRLPKTSHLLKPPWPPSVTISQRDQDNRKRQASDFNRRHAAHTLWPLQAGERVWGQDVNSPATVLGPAQRPRFYVVKTPMGVLQRNRMHPVPTTGTPTANPPGTPVADQPEATTTPELTKQHKTSKPRRLGKAPPLQRNLGVQLLRHVSRGMAGGSPGRKDSTC
ncbi:uncharacterized protein K02A2.6-like [Rhipicephalus sanguineus]|uniref:uncharacterized protein K02A2.6-like n=1 Tax=Rhipicephalus sanguineus TaxID=34632 RepID=UPI0018958313|nr:uncharacterized protein K02A2.6-like [Rhipicephalus sanguineus]